MLILQDIRVIGRIKSVTINCHRDLKGAEITRGSLVREKGGLSGKAEIGD